jgi:hypothetical protein
MLLGRSRSTENIIIACPRGSTDLFLSFSPTKFVRSGSDDGRFKNCTRHKLMEEGDLLHHCQTFSLSLSLSLYVSLSVTSILFAGLVVTS